MSRCIIGGYEIEIHLAPYQVNYGDECGGALIHRKWVLTTAHCGTNHTYIRVGSSHRLRGPKILVISHFIHPMYKKKHEFDYDVQLLAIRSLHFSRMVYPINISEHFGQNIYVAGWGYQKERGDYHDTLQQAMITMVPMKECQTVKNKWYNHSLTPRMFCAGGWGRDACQGDSGGPAVSRGKLVGLSSFGFGCGRRMPGVYTNISESSIREWIREHTGV
ncbi:trypsin-2-like [Helicoverpa armigera]|uniref:trypsin-2-like n=1 Tax=Helicoverpa armigera TaxID=29058 RepID=UPI0030834B94